MSLESDNLFVAAVESTQDPSAGLLVALDVCKAYRKLQEQTESIQTENTQLKASALNKRIKELKADKDRLNALFYNPDGSMRLTPNMEEEAKACNAVWDKLQVEEENRKLQEKAASMGEVIKKLNKIEQKHIRLVRDICKSSGKLRSLIKPKSGNEDFFSMLDSLPDWMEGELREAYLKAKTEIMGLDKELANRKDARLSEGEG